MRMPSFLLPPPARGPAVAPSLLLVLTLLLAGCAREPSPPQAGGTIPLQVHNETQERRTVLIGIEPAAGGSPLLVRELVLAPRTTNNAETALLPHGDYVLVASSGPTSREVRVEYRHDTQYFRFVLHDQVIAFQSG